MTAADDPVAVADARRRRGPKRFPFFNHLTLAEIAERDRLTATALREGLPMAKLHRLRDLRLRSYPRRWQQ